MYGLFGKEATSKSQSSKTQISKSYKLIKKYGRDGESWKKCADNGSFTDTAIRATDTKVDSLSELRKHG